MERMSTVFVTVGTTDFNGLIKAIDCEYFVETLLAKCCACLVVQVGRGVEPVHLPKICEDRGIKFICFHFKASLLEDMQAADLIVCHAGAGSITDALSLQKKVMVVVNESLMNNHQAELARAVVAKGYCFSSVPERVVQDLRSANFANINPYPPVDYSAFPNFFDDVVNE